MQRRAGGRLKHGREGKRRNGNDGRMVIRGRTKKN
jgi:hypothetical protein